ncbi:MAG: Hsp20/alpha crystallin family protein [Bacteroidia bacterium]|nr:Hsp20/alpha crystallin family protein [Bacteroidia bacterium]
MTLTKFKPAKSILTDTFFSPGFEALFNDLMVDGGRRTGFETPKASVKEDDQKFQIDLVMAGMDKKDISLDVKDHELIVQGQKEETQDDKGTKFHLREFRTDKFKRSFFLPEVADVENIQAEFKNGILEIQVPKKEKAKPKVISIK